MRGREAIRIGRAAAGTLSIVDISWCDIRLAQRDHASTSVEGIAEAVSWGLLRRIHSAKVNK